jgi:hypothetical protein
MQNLWSLFGFVCPPYMESRHFSVRRKEEGDLSDDRNFYFLSSEILDCRRRSAALSDASAAAAYIIL